MAAGRARGREQTTARLNSLDVILVLPRPQCWTLVWAHDELGKKPLNGRLVIRTYTALELCATVPMRVVVGSSTPASCRAGPPTTRCGCVVRLHTGASKKVLSAATCASSRRFTPSTLSTSAARQRVALQGSRLKQFCPTAFATAQSIHGKLGWSIPTPRHRSLSFPPPTPPIFVAGLQPLAVCSLAPPPSATVADVGIEWRRP